MTEHTDKVKKHKKLLELENWRKKVKCIIGECKTPGGVITHTTIYNDDSKDIEYLRSKRKPKHIPSPHKDADLLHNFKGEEDESNL